MTINVEILRGLFPSFSDGLKVSVSFNTHYVLRVFWF